MLLGQLDTDYLRNAAYFYLGSFITLEEVVQELAPYLGHYRPILQDEDPRPSISERYNPDTLESMLECRFEALGRDASVDNPRCSGDQVC